MSHLPIMSSSLDIALSEILIYVHGWFVVRGPVRI